MKGKILKRIRDTIRNEWVWFLIITIIIFLLMNRLMIREFNGMIRMFKFNKIILLILFNLSIDIFIGLNNLLLIRKLLF